jgi:hypothetical protein
MQAIAAYPVDNTRLLECNDLSILVQSWRVDNAAVDVVAVSDHDAMGDMEGRAGVVRVWKVKMQIRVYVVLVALPV